jgi:hypothetical protein
VLLAAFLLRAAAGGKADATPKDGDKREVAQAAPVADPFARFPSWAGWIWGLVALLMYIAVLQEEWTWAGDNRAAILGAASAVLALVAVTAQMTEVRYDRLGKQSHALRWKLQARMWTAEAGAIGASALALSLGVCPAVCAIGLIVLVIAPPALSSLVAREGEGVATLLLLGLVLVVFILVAIVVFGIL